MKTKSIAMALAAVALLTGGCFKNQGKPADVPTVIGLEALAKTNRAEVVRLLLRGTKTPIPADALKAGMNAFSVTFPQTAGKGTTFNDFALRIIPQDK